MLRRNIAATSLVIIWKKLYSVKCNDISNMNVKLSLWENFLWGWIYFDQFILAKSDDPDEMLHNAAFQPGLYCLLS